MIYLTRQEQRIVILLCALIVLSIGIIAIKRFHPEWFLRASLGQPDIDMRKDQAKSSKPIQPSEAIKLSNTVKSQEPTITQNAQTSVSKEKSQEMPLTKININTATIDELVQLPGIGKVKAKNIVEYRNKNGNFTEIDELLNVNGIGEKTLDKIKDFITTGEKNSKGKTDTETNKGEN
ncbi:MAG: ComEA family DNA-binding protein [Candidatus Poribacteria bacterium]